jgi:hypothetical protein
MTKYMTKHSCLRLPEVDVEAGGCTPPRPQTGQQVRSLICKKCFSGTNLEQSSQLKYVHAYNCSIVFRTNSID